MNMRQLLDKHPIKVWFVTVVACCMIAGLMWGLSSKAAFGTESQTVDQKMCTHTNPDGECWFGAKKSAHKFRDGYFHRSHGMPVKKMFRHPLKARKFFSTKLSHRIDHLSHRHRSRIAWKFFGRHQHTSGRTGGGALERCYGVTDCYGCSDYCLAWKMYGDLMTHAGCTGSDRPTTAPDTCHWPDTESSITKGGVQRGGALVICGAAVAIGVLSAPATAGTGTVAAAGITGAVGCGWSFWASFD